MVGASRSGRDKGATLPEACIRIGKNKTGRLHLLRYAEQPLVAEFGILYKKSKKSVMMNATELFKAVYVDPLGPEHTDTAKTGTLPSCARY